MSIFTPSPWGFNSHKNIVYTTVSPQIPIATVVTTPEDFYPLDTGKANGRLLAAAPDLLAALTAFVDTAGSHWQASPGHKDIMQRILEQARADIKTALG